MKLTRLFSASGITLVLAAGSLAVMSPAVASTGTGMQPSAIVADSNHSQIVDLFSAINSYRVSHGFPVFRYNSTISANSQQWSDGLPATGQPALNPNFDTAPALQGWMNSQEMVGGQWDRSAAEMVAQWAADPVNNSVLENPNLNTIGIGITYTDNTVGTSLNTYATYAVVDAFWYGPELAGTSSDPTQSCFVADNGAPVCIDNGFNPAPPPGTGGTIGDPTPTPIATAPPAPTPPPTITTEPLTPISTKYDASNGTVTLGFPTSPEIATVRGGYYRNYDKGTIYWSAATGAYVSSGATNTLYQNLSAEKGNYGFPTSDIKASARGGFVQNYENGDIYTTAAGTVSSYGGIRSVYRASGAESGPYGYPLTNERPSVNGGVSQDYENGTIYWSPYTGVNPTFGAIRSMHNANGAERGRFGYPKSGEIPTGSGGGVIQNFQNGSIVWSPANGVNAVVGGIGDFWKNSGGAGGNFGYPTSGEVPTGNGGGVIQNYENGSIVWSSSTGVKPVIGGIGATWKEHGGANGYLGYPTSGEGRLSRGGGTYQSYQHGAIIWTPGYGAFLNVGAIRAKYGSLGYESGRLGWPTSNEYPTSSGVAQNYYGGRIAYNSRTGAVTVSY